jgi:hypothetical protein
MYRSGGHTLPKNYCYLSRRVNENLVFTRNRGRPEGREKEGKWNGWSADVSAGRSHDGVVSLMRPPPLLHAEHLAGIGIQLSSHISSTQSTSPTSVFSFRASTTAVAPFLCTPRGYWQPRCRMWTARRSQQPIGRTCSSTHAPATT